MKKYLISFLACIVIAATLSGSCFAVSTGGKLVHFKARAMSGETVNLDKIVKKKPVMLFFWASW